jgi:hypothetical protein
MNDAPRNQSATPVADKNEQEQGADEWQPIAVDLFTNLITGQITQVVPEELQQVLHSARITLHLAGAKDNHSKKGANNDPGAKKNLTVNIQIADLPVEVVTHLEFGKGKV